MKRRNRERGAVSVEFALCVPILVILVLGGLHLGRVLAARHRLSDAVGYAARASMVATPPGGIASAGTANANVQARMSDVQECSSVTTSTVTVGVAPYRMVTVKGTCHLVPPFGGGLLGNLGIDTVVATASMPLN